MARIAHIVLILAVGIGIFGGMEIHQLYVLCIYLCLSLSGIKTTPTNTPATINSGITLTHVSRWIFLILTLLFMLVSMYGTFKIQFYEHVSEDTVELKEVLPFTYLFFRLLICYYIYRASSSLYYWGLLSIFEQFST